MSEVKDNIRLGLGQGAGEEGWRRRRVSLECVAWLVE